MICFWKTQTAAHRCALSHSPCLRTLYKLLMFCPHSAPTYSYRNRKWILNTSIPRIASLQQWDSLTLIYISYASAKRSQEKHGEQHGNSENLCSSLLWKHQLWKQFNFQVGWPGRSESLYHLCCWIAGFHLLLVLYLSKCYEACNWVEWTKHISFLFRKFCLAYMLSSKFYLRDNTWVSIYNSCQDCFFFRHSLVCTTQNINVITSWSLRRRSIRRGAYADEFSWIYA